MASLAEIRAKLKEQEANTGGTLKKAKVQLSVSFLMQTIQTLSFGKNV
jgi:hypothetical protein